MSEDGARRAKRWAAGWTWWLGALWSSIAMVRSMRALDAVEAYRQLLLSLPGFLMVAAVTLWPVPLDRRESAPCPSVGPSVSESIGPSAGPAAAAGGRNRLAARTWVLLGWLAVLLCVAVANPPQRSRDVWAYASYGRLITEYKESPYVVAPSAHPDDPVVRLMATGWRKSRSVYGPAYMAAAAVGSWWAGDSTVRLRLWFQGISALAALSVAVMIAGHRPSRLPLLALNPLVVVATVHEAHTDLLLGLCVLGGVLLLRNQRHALGALALAAGALVKLTGLLPFGAAAIWLVARRGPRRGSLDVAGGAAALAVGYGLAGGLAAVRPVSGIKALRSLSSLWSAPWVRSIADGPAGGPSAVAQTLPMLLVAATAVVVAVASRRADDPLAVAVLPALVYLASALYVLPWYLGLVLPVVALAAAPPVAAALIGFQTWMLVAYGAGTRQPPGLDRLQKTALARLRLAELVVLAGLTVAVAFVVRRHGVIVPAESPRTPPTAPPPEPLGRRQGGDGESSASG